MHGTVTVDQETGTFTYNPDDGFTGPDQFTVVASEATDCLHMHGVLSLLGWRGMHTDPATIRLNVVGANQAPVATPDSVTTVKNTPVTGNVLTNDSDVEIGSLIATLVSTATNGLVVLNSDGSFSYTPNANWTGIDSFSYTASDGQATSSTALVTIAVTSVNEAPVAGDDTFSTPEDNQLVGNVLDNDTDPDGTTPTTTLVDGPLHGVVELGADGTFAIDPMKTSVAQTHSPTRPPTARCRAKRL